MEMQVVTEHLVQVGTVEAEAVLAVQVLLIQVQTEVLAA